MNRFKNILLPHFGQDVDRATLNRAVELARRNKARLTLAELPEVDHALAAADRQGDLDGVVATFRRDGIEVASKRLLDGPPAIAIIREVLRHRHDLVMWTTRTESGVKPVFFGNTSMRLMRKCPCPVWVSKRDQPRYETIVAAVDLGGVTPENDELNQLILELAASLASEERCKLHLVHAWEFVGNDLDTARSEISEAELGELVRKKTSDLGNRFRKRLESFELSEVEFTIELLHGRPDREIPRLVSEVRADLLVMGSVSRTGITGFLIGNTAETVLQQVECSVLTVKPRNFVTPVTLE